MVLFFVCRKTFWGNFSRKKIKKMNLSGSTIQFPVLTDARGTVKTVSNRSELIAQEIAEVIQTRKGSRVLMPDFGLADYVFSTANIGFELLLKIEIETQIKRYVPLVEAVQVVIKNDGDGRIIADLRYTERGEFQSPKNLVYPIWQLIGN
jgi:phage baseplate assembly protein W